MFLFLCITLSAVLWLVLTHSLFVALFVQFNFVLTTRYVRLLHCRTSLFLRSMRGVVRSGAARSGTARCLPKIIMLVLSLRRHRIVGLFACYARSDAPIMLFTGGDIPMCTAGLLHGWYSTSFKDERPHSQFAVALDLVRKSEECGLWI